LAEQAGRHASDRPVYLLDLPGLVLGLVWVGWFAVLSGMAVSFTATVLSRERDLGVRDVLGSAPLSPGREVLGRWAAAMLQCFEPWLLGSFVPITVLFTVDPHNNPLIQLGLWLLCLPWLAAVAAVGLVCSITFRTMSRSLAATLAALMGAPVVCMAVPMIYASVSYAYGLGPSPSPEDVAPLACLPPSPCLFFAVASPPMLLWLLPAWLLFVPVTLWIGAVLIRRGWSLEPSGRPRVQSALLPAPHPHAIDPSDRATGMGWSPLDGVLGGNPFYVAWRKGFMRLYPTLSAPGSLVPPIFVIAALIVPTAVGMCGTTMPDEAMQALVLGALAAASFYG